MLDDRVQVAETGARGFNPCANPVAHTITLLKRNTPLSACSMLHAAPVQTRYCTVAQDLVPAAPPETLQNYTMAAVAGKSDPSSGAAPRDDVDSSGAAPPTSSFLTPLLTDMYQITMAYAYWKNGKHNDRAVFDLFFRKNPFKGEYTVFGGLEEALRLVQTFNITKSDIDYLRTKLPKAEDEFWAFLGKVDCSEVQIHAVAEGTVVFPRVPLIRVEGPLLVCQLLETPFLNCTNFASLMATNACRFRQAAGKDKTLIEFGLRRAQGTDGAMSASRYSSMGGFDATSNVLAGKTFGMDVRGTHAHSFVSTYTALDDVKQRVLAHNPERPGKPAEGAPDSSKLDSAGCSVAPGSKSFAKQEDGSVDLLARAWAWRQVLGFDSASDSELAAFTAYALAFPDGFLALVDTYETLQSGVPNFLSVALALAEQGYSPRGIRLDSGDLAYLSKEARKMMKEADAATGASLAGSSKIVASNSINEAVLNSLNDQGHEIDVYGIGTNLVTCQAQPALGMVFKLVEVNGAARIKISQDIAKVTIPGSKEAYRLIGRDSQALLDVIIARGEAAPAAGSRMLCRHPFDEKKRVYVTPSFVMPLLAPVWLGNKSGGFLEAAEKSESSESPGAAAGDGAGTGAASGAGSGEVSAEAADKLPVECATGRRCRLPPMDDLKKYVGDQLLLLREDHMRPLNPTPYKVSVSAGLYQFVHKLWSQEVPIPELG